MSIAPSLDRAAIERIVREIVFKQSSGAGGNGAPKAPELVVSVSARHVHLTDADVETLFGRGAVLNAEKPLYQDGFFAAAISAPD